MRRLRELRDRDLALADADRFDQHHVETEGIHQQHRVGGRAGEAAEMSAARHRTNEDGVVGEVFGETDAIAEQRAVRERRAGIDRNDADALSERARLAHECRGERRFSDARRSGEADRHRASGLWIERANQIAAAARLRARDRPRERAGIAPLELAQNASDAGQVRLLRLAARADLPYVEGQIPIVRFCAARASRSPRFSRIVACCPLPAKRWSFRSPANECATSRPRSSFTRSSTTFSRGRRNDVRADRRHSGDVAARFVGANDSIHPLSNGVSGAARAFRGRDRTQRSQHAHAIPTPTRSDADYTVWERKWEVDSPAWPVVLASVYWRSTRDATRLHARPASRAFARSSQTYNCEERHRSVQPLSLSVSRLHQRRVQRGDGDDLGRLSTLGRCGRVPLQHSAKRDGGRRPARHRAARNRRISRPRARPATRTRSAARVQRRHPALRTLLQSHSTRVWMYAYETDGFGRYNLMDDANIPKPYDAAVYRLVLGLRSTYLATRAFALSMDNPFYFSRDATRKGWEARTRRTATSGRWESSAAR